VHSADATTAGGDTVSVTSSVYSCSNRACSTAIVVRLSLTSGYLDTDLDAGRLTGDDAAAYARGRTTRDGVWQNRAGVPRTTPAQHELFAS
jgi:hypothetical protein